MKDNELLRCANTVLLPAFADTTLSKEVKSFLRNGGCSILIGESREEYVKREMSNDRKNNETESTLKSLIEEAKSFQKDLIVAVDQEVCGIQRLHNLVPNFPKPDELKEIKSEDFQLICKEVAIKARAIGINCFLAPILDVVTGENPWLRNRTWSTNPIEIAHLTSGFIREVQQEKIISTAKHFPGFSNIKLDPAIEKNAVMDGSLESIIKGYLPFEFAIKNNVEMIMMGPAIVNALDKLNPASISPSVISVLRDKLKFNGIILSDGLDAKATMQNSTIEQIAVRSLKAGCDFLLIADIDDQIYRVSNAIKEAVKNGNLNQNKLILSAEKVRLLAEKYN